MHIGTSLKTEKKEKASLSIVANESQELRVCMCCHYPLREICLEMALGEAFMMSVPALPELGSMCFSLY